MAENVLGTWLVRLRMQSDQLKADLEKTRGLITSETGKIRSKVRQDFGAVADQIRQLGKAGGEVSAEKVARLRVELREMGEQARKAGTSTKGFERALATANKQLDTSFERVKKVRIEQAKMDDSIRLSVKSATLQQQLFDANAGKMGQYARAFTTVGAAAAGGFYTGIKLAERAGVDMTLAMEKLNFVLDKAATAIDISFNKAAKAVTLSLAWMLEKVGDAATGALTLVQLIEKAGVIDTMTAMAQGPAALAILAHDMGIKAKNIFGDLTQSLRDTADGFEMNIDANLRHRDAMRETGKEVKKLKEDFLALFDAVAKGMTGGVGERGEAAEGIFADLISQANMAAGAIAGIVGGTTSQIDKFMGDSISAMFKSLSDINDEFSMLGITREEQERARLERWYDDALTMHRGNAEAKAKIDAIYEARKKESDERLKMSQLQAFNQGLSAFGSILGTMANMQDTHNRKGFKRAQQLRMAEVIVNTATSISTIWAAHADNPILAAVLTALAVAMGLAQMKTIRSTTYEGGGALPSGAGSAGGGAVAETGGGPTVETGADTTTRASAPSAPVTAPAPSGPQIMQIEWKGAERGFFRELAKGLVVEVRDFDGRLIATSLAG